ncbi:hemerythrin domain-containing protein [Noviherbaspirillum denitrificans]|uniref:Hemerythrin HHE cation-binding protein n=1 Tax=Noviherbaspirillum denitrificans TaxID=1968433 RepID=A0A254TFR0_9BURK|nr:hemerythrin domain-containing protein [Noviherbaspirillum denitrificans]OWW21460.1 hemerythrin HHE cation-binding protein [Noviherbaspirillum denitrificans]
METISSHLGTDHKRCDDFFAQAETAVAGTLWTNAELAMNAFVEALEQHFAMEEQVLFPAFEEATGSNAGPTSVMRMEHRQMREVISAMNESLAQRDADGFLGYSETLNTLMQQHNMKEESILYPMSDRVLDGQQEALIGAMRETGITS